MKIPLCKPVFDEEMKLAALDAFQNERFVMGESVFKFEDEFARYCGVKYAVATSSGTSALELSLLATGVQEGQRVITTPVSFIATANAALYVKAVPEFADIDIRTYTIDPKLMKMKITKRTKAVIPVHLYGFPADMDTILEFSDEHKLITVEDACQAHGAECHGRKVGSIGDIGCFSFYPSKNMTVCGDGGMVVTDDQTLAKTVAKLRDCGRMSHYEHDLVGVTSRLNTANAAIGRVQLRRLDEWNNRRRRAARMYDRLLSDLDKVTLPPNGGRKARPVYHLYVIRTRLRNKLKLFLERHGIECGIHYPIPIHLQPVYRKLFGYEEGAFPESELLSHTALSLPMFPQIEEREVQYVSSKVHEFFDLQD